MNTESTKKMCFIHPGYYDLIELPDLNIDENRILQRKNLTERLKKSGGKIKNFFWPSWYKKMAFVVVYTEKTSGIKFHVVLDENNFSKFENALALGSPQGIRREGFYFVRSKDIREKKCTYLNVLTWVMLRFFKETYLMEEILKEGEKEKELEGLIEEIEYMVSPDQSFKRNEDDKLKETLRKIVKIFGEKRSKYENNGYLQQFFLLIERIGKEIYPG